MARTSCWRRGRIMSLRTRPRSRGWWRPSHDPRREDVARPVRDDEPGQDRRDRRGAARAGHLVWRFAGRGRIDDRRAAAGAGRAGGELRRAEMAVGEMADSARAMKRFYKDAAAVPGLGGVGIELDGRPVKTPGKRPLALPTEELAEAIAAEWNAQGDEIDPRSMPLTGLANAAIDLVASDPAAFAETLAPFGETDLLYYRSEGPQELVR